MKGIDSVRLATVRGGIFFSAWVIPALVAGMLFAEPGSAATSDDQQKLLEQMLAHPADHATTFEYVRVSEELGDYEAAVGALERLLFFNPKLTRVKFELGALYYRLGSYEMAGRYFREALASPDLDADTRARIAAYLPEAEKQRSPVRSWFFLQSGLRYQSNASVTPSSGMVDLGGAQQALDLSGPHGDDWNAFVLGQFANDIDLQDQRGDKIETRASGYLTRQFRLTGLDVGLLNASIGPRFALAPAMWKGLTVKPYLTGGASWVGGLPSETNGGGGVSFTVPLGSHAIVSPSIEWQRAAYATSDPTATLGTADWLTSSITAAARVNDALSLTATASYRRAQAGNAWQSYNQFTAQFGASLRFNPPSSRMAQKWTLAPFVQYVQTTFDAPNAAVDPLVTRADGKWQVGIGLDAPITPHFGLAATAIYEKTDSNITNYAYDNWSILFGPTARF